MAQRIKLRNSICNLLPYEREDLLTIQDVQQKIGWEITAFNLPEAWKFTEGEGVVVAVLDTGVDLDHEDLVGNLLPGRNFVDPNLPPEDDNGHGCVSPDCLVHTNFGGIQEIESLYDSIDCTEKICNKKEGTYFIKKTDGLKTYSFDANSQNSIIGEIESIQKIAIDTEVVHIELEGNTTYVLTPWHPVYLIKNKHHKKYEIIRKRADEIEIGDQFIFGRGPICGKLGCKQFVDLPKKIVCKICRHQPKYYLEDEPKKCKKCFNKNWIKKEVKVEIDQDLAYLAGIVLTDGNISKDRFEVSSTTCEILQKVKNIAESKKWKFQIEDKRILVYGKAAVNHLLSMGILNKEKSLRQTLPKWVGKADHLVQAAFIAGVIDGDGCISRSNTKNRITTASYVFAREMDCLLNSWGISSYTSSPEYDNRKRHITSKNPVYKIVHTALPLEIINCLVHPNKIIRSMIVPKSSRTGRRVRSKSFKKYCGYFYDFTVKDHHNYIADGHFVSNTHVTGIICAANNDFGVVGVAPKTKVMPLKVLDKKGAGNLPNVANAIRYAADQKVDFITMSLGAPGLMPMIQDAIRYAASKGTVTWCAAGNAGKTHQIFYPAAYPEVIGIGAIDENFDRASFSCTGPDLDFVAPGVKILSTVPDNWYAVLSGTSMANPFAVGVASLLLSHKRIKNLDVKLNDANDYINFMKSYTTPINNPAFAGQKFFEGFGIIDPRKMEEWVKSN